MKSSALTIGLAPGAMTPESSATAARRRPAIALNVLLDRARRGPRGQALRDLRVPRRRFLRTVATAAAASGSTSPAKSEVQVALDQMIASGVPGAVVLARDGNRTTTLAGGYGNLKQKTPTHATDRFRVGSMTKTFVATVVLQLVGEGRLAARRHGRAAAARRDPERQGDHRASTAEHDERPLRLPQRRRPTVTTSLLRGDLTYRWTPRQLIAISNAHKPRFAPGTSWSYCSTCYILLGHDRREGDRKPDRGRAPKPDLRAAAAYGRRASTRACGSPAPHAHGLRAARQATDGRERAQPVARLGGGRARLERTRPRPLLPRAARRPPPPSGSAPRDGDHRPAESGTSAGPTVSASSETSLGCGHRVRPSRLDRRLRGVRVQQQGRKAPSRRARQPGLLLEVRPDGRGSQHALAAAYCSKSAG